MDKLDSQRINKILNIMKPADKAYWNHDTNNIISDSEYDSLYEQLKDLYSKYPDDKRMTKYFSTMHQDQDNTLAKVRHRYHVISLAKVRHPDEVIRFLDKWSLNKDSTWYTDSFLIQPKQDGLSMVMYFNDPRMPHKKLTVLTRGSGRAGADVTNEAYYYLHMNIGRIMKRIGNRHVVVRGEALISRKSFEQDRKHTPFKNERNLVSGTVMNKDPKTVAERGVFISAYTLLNRDEYINKYPTEMQQMQFMNRLGFSTTTGVHRFPNTKQGKEDAMRFIFSFSHSQRLAVGHDIDGLVIKPNYTANFDKIGWNQHNPKYAEAYKFPPEQTLAKIKTVRWQESAMGKLTPVLIFDHPAHIFGAYITKATGASIPTMEKYHIMINGYVTIKRMNDVIPKAFGVPALNKSVNDLKSPLATLPKGSFRNGPFYYLHVSSNSMPVILNRWKKFVSKPCLNIMGLSDKVIKTMIKHDLIDPHDFSSLWKIDHGKFIHTPSFAEKGWQNLQKELHKIHDCPLDRVLLGLPINNAGEFILKPVAQRIGNMNTILTDSAKRNSKKQELLKDMPNLKGHGSADIPVIKHLFSEPILKQLKELSKHLKLTEPIVHKATNTNSNIKGMKFCITGRLNHPRKYYKKLIQSNDAKLASAVSGNTDYLICNQQSSSSKYRNAVKKHVPIINEKQFKNLIKEK